jgi:tryptophan-rich sensory protein
MTAQDSTKARYALMGLVALAPVFIAAALGSVVTAPAIKTWYATLAKPFFTPPNWLFGPAWTALYVLMAYAFWRILVLPKESAGRPRAILAFIVQIALNALWSFAFFGWKSPAAGLVVVFALWLAIAVTIARFRPLDSVAAWCLAPYLAWVTFASALNFAIWLKN